MASAVSRNTTEEMKEFLLRKGICEEVACDFERNRVSGQAFMELREEDLKELVPMIGVRTEIRRILKECREVSGYSNNYSCINGT